MSPQKTKTFVLDTNVILHDSSCLHQFGDNDIVLPIPVLEELDNFKKGNDIINFHARQFVRQVDALSGRMPDVMFNEGLKIGSELGKISILLDSDFHEDLSRSFGKDKADHRILNIAYNLSKAEPHRNVILVSKDVNLRMKAKSVGLPAEDYTTDQVEDVQSLYTGMALLENVELERINQLYESPGEIDANSIDLEKPPFPNQFYILRNNKRSALAMYKKDTHTIKHLDKFPAYGITPRNAEQTFAVNALLDPEIQLATLSGKAGTGKTLIALSAALEQEQHYDQIFLARPIVPLSNKDTGFLPGDIEAKLNPYMQPLFDNLSVIKTNVGSKGDRFNRIEEMRNEDQLKIAPLSYIRGRSLVNIFFIVDEAQNLTPHEIKTIITRAGEGTKIVFTGDIYQIDHPYLDSHSCGLTYLIDKMKGQEIYAHINMQKGERSELAELASNLL